MYAVSRLLSMTLRWDVSGYDRYKKSDKGLIFCAWHGRSLIPAQFLRGKGLWALFSLSRDGQMQSRLFELLGYRSIRGSTGRGGERAAIEAIRLLRKGESLAVTPDGPRGPNREVQGGVLLMAKKSGALLVPMGADANRKWTFRSWDGYLLPKPFARVTLRFGDPIAIEPDATEAQIEEARIRLGEAMSRLESEPTPITNGQAEAASAPPTTLKGRWRQTRPKFLAPFLYLLARAVSATLRWRVTGIEKADAGEKGVLLCIWHGRTFLPANYMRNRGIWALFSLSNDGELQSRVFSLLGYRVIRGSTGRGGERAAVEAIRVLRKGDTLAITPDGPRGPAGEIQGGALLMARKSGAALVPIGASAGRRWLIGTWDRYLMPKPFARASIRFGEPIWISPDADEAEIEQVREKLAAAMNRLQDEAEQDVGRTPVHPPGRQPSGREESRSAV